MRGTLLTIDDDPDMRWAIRSVLSGAGFDVAEADNGGRGLEMATQCPPDAVLLDIQMPDLVGDELLRRLRRFDAGLPVIVVTAYGSIAGAVDAIRAGAFEYITKPFRNEQLLDVVQRALAQRRASQAAPVGAALRTDITATMGHSAAIQSLVDTIEAVVKTDYSVLIQGETGVGKEVVARALRQHGLRAKRPFVVVDCGAMVDNLTDTAFFGHEKGAYTGADRRQLGWFETAANGGTIFLDEIGNLSLAGQKALLRTLEERVIHRVGSTAPVRLDTRVIAATNENLEGQSAAGQFRQDLFFRLAEYVIAVPPLRARPDDIEFLARRFLAEARASLRRPPLDISSAALDLLRSCDWPGNVRELRNILRRAALIEAPCITPSHLNGFFGADISAAATAPQTGLTQAPLRDLIHGKIREVERQAVLAALERARGNKAEAARLLGIDYKTYRMKLKMFGDPTGADNDARR